MSQFDFCGYRDIYVEFSQLINFMPVKQRAYHMNLRITSHITVAHRRNKERAQGVPWAPPLRSKKGPIRSKIWGKRTKMRSIRGVFFHENTCSKSKFRSKGAELFLAHPILLLNCAYAVASSEFSLHSHFC